MFTFCDVLHETKQKQTLKSAHKDWKSLLSQETKYALSHPRVKLMQSGQCEASCASIFLHLADLAITRQWETNKKVSKSL